MLELKNKEEKIDSNELPLEYQVFALAFQDKDALPYFSDYLPVRVIGAMDDGLGLKQFYQSLLEFYSITKSTPIDPIAFRSWLETDTNLYSAINELIGIDAFMESLLSLKVSNPEQVSAVLRKRADTRHQMDALMELQSLLSKKENKTAEDDQKIEQLTMKIRQLQASSNYDPFEKLTSVEDIKQSMDSIFDIPEFLPTPFPSYNEALAYSGTNGGIIRGAVQAIVANSGQGKSTFCKNLCNHWLDLGFKVLFINYEETRNHWEKILLSQIIEKNVYAHAEEWTEEEKEEHRQIFVKRLDQWGDNLRIKHSPETSYYDDLDKWLRDLISVGSWLPDVVVIDTIQSLVGKSNGPRWGDYEMMMINLERLAKDINAAVILTAQQNNDAVKENREIIKQSDIGGSLTIVQKCSVISVITEKKLLTQDDTMDERIMQIQIVKNRITGKQTLNNMPTIIYDDESKSYKEYHLSAAEQELKLDFDSLATLHNA